MHGWGLGGLEKIPSMGEVWIFSELHISELPFARVEMSSCKTTHTAFDI